MVYNKIVLYMLLPLLLRPNSCPSIANHIERYYAVKILNQIVAHRFWLNGNNN